MLFSLSCSKLPIPPTRGAHRALPCEQKTASLLSQTTVYVRVSRRWTARELRFGNRLLVLMQPC
jgi:hypothetical protein